ncbi:MAG: chromosomal replication initiator protein DnaA [Desulfatiglans sp.]|jgi:chromosomal replication initiator protein|nr:chromosomal replication initiator protein DnaA [Thermodesulfobacteriota bacterium]MEE4353446.1 chromosomal replication initiator protein DnaA [Desulfatiglans sp.]
MFTNKAVWDKITASLKSDIAESEFDIWLSQAALKELKPGWAEIEVSNKFVAHWLKEHYLDHIKQSFKKNFKIQPQIHFTIRPPQEERAIKIPRRSKDTGLIFSHDINPLFSFNNYIKASNNRFTYSSALQVADNPVGHYNPLFIHCELSSGKTHLLHAIANRVSTNLPSLDVRYIPMEQFYTEWSAASESESTPRFRELYGAIDFLVIDDIQLVSGKSNLQKEIVLLFDTFFSSNKQMVFAGKTAPKNTDGMNPDLSSRLGSGLVCEMNTLDQKTKIKILKKKAKEKNIKIHDDVVFFLSNSTNDIKTLVQYLFRIESGTSFYNRSIDISTAKSIIKNGEISNVDIRHIQKLTASYFGISMTDLLSNKKRRNFSYPRQIAMYLSRNLTDLSFKAIGEAFGRKDHSTVLYAVRNIDKKRDKDRRVLEDINQLQSFIE